MLTPRQMLSPAPNLLGAGTRVLVVASMRMSMSTTTLPSIPRPTEPISASRTASNPGRERLLSLDVFRGMTVAGMLLVNDPGSWEHIYTPLEHARVARTTTGTS